MELHAVDTETKLFFPSTMAPELVCVSAATSRENGRVFHGRDPECYDYLKYVLEHCAMTLANGPYDFGVIGRRWPQLIPLIFQALDDNRVHDVLIREKLIDIGRGTYRFTYDAEGNRKGIQYSLADTFRRRTGNVMEKDEFRMRYHDFEHLPLSEWPPGAIQYALGDAQGTYWVHELQAPMEPMITDEFAQVRASWALNLMSTWGVRTNQKAVLSLERRVIEEMDEVQDILVGFGLVRADGSRDTKSAKEIMFSVMGADAVLTDKAMDRVKKKESTRLEEHQAYNISLNKEVCLLSGHEALMKYGRYGQLQNLLRKDVKDLKRGAILPIHTRFNSLMSSGRTSSSSPNIQNLRREPGVRECFVPRRGNVFVAADYGTAELVSLSQVCLNLFGYSKMADAINAGMDVHIHVAAQLLKISYEEASAAYKDEKHPLHKDVAEKRQLAKALNFGLPGGLGAKTFIGYVKGYGVELTFEEAAKLKKDWLKAWPEMVEYFRFIGNQANEDGLIWIKQHVTDRVRGGCFYTQAANSLFQGLTSDAVKAAGYEIAKLQFLHPESPLYGTATVNLIHDEFLIECREEIAHEVAMALQEVMVRIYQKYTPGVRIEADAHVMHFWSKKAKAVWHDLEGNVVNPYTFEGEKRLVPWGRSVYEDEEKAEAA